MEEIDLKKHQEIDAFVSNDKPTYRFLLNQRPEVYEKIPAGLNPDALEMELHKQVQEWETEIKKHVFGRICDKTQNHAFDFRKGFNNTR